MTEQFLEKYTPEKGEIIRNANRRLAYSISAVGLTGELMVRAIRYMSLDGVDAARLEAEIGQTIRHLVQDHLNTYMQGPTCIRGGGVAMGANASEDLSHIGAVLDIDSGQLYDAKVPREKRSVTEPLPDMEWFRHWRGVIAATNTMKIY